MIYKARYIVLLLTVVLLLAALAPAILAQGEKEPSSFKNVKLWVYPEYDDPRLLVMLEGKIVGAQPPATLRFLVPEQAEMYSAGSMDAQGKYTGGPPTRLASSTPEWDVISFIVSTDTFRVEYYDPIIRGQPDKSISYEFRSLYPISDLSVTILEPSKSSNFNVSPKGQIVKEQGSNSHLYTYSDIGSESPLRFEISYTRSDPNPSVPPGGSNPQTAVSDSNSNAIAIMAVILLIVVGFGLIWLTRSRGRAKTRKRAVRTVAADVRRDKYCRMCGEPLRSSARFCPGCGVKLQ